MNTAFNPSEPATVEGDGIYLQHGKYWQWSPISGTARALPEAPPAHLSHKERGEWATKYLAAKAGFGEDVSEIDEQSLEWVIEDMQKWEDGAPRPDEWKMREWIGKLRRIKEAP